MPKEIEHKYLIKNDSWRSDNKGTEFQQGYFSIVQPAIRVRIADDQGLLTIKSSEAGISRSEFEYVIPLQDAKEMLKKYCHGKLIKKTRYVVEYKGKTWEVDEFHDKNQGLIVAEIELTAEDEQYELPPWIGKEVSDDPRYYNAYLYKYPYTEWRKDKM